MLIEQIIALIKRTRPPGRTYTSIAGYFHDKKISQENLRVDYYLLLKCSQRQSTLLLPT